MYLALVLFAQQIGTYEKHGQITLPSVPSVVSHIYCANPILILRDGSSLVSYKLIGEKLLKIRDLGTGSPTGWSRYDALFCADQGYELLINQKGSRRQQGMLGVVRCLDYWILRNDIYHVLGENVFHTDGMILGYSINFDGLPVLLLSDVSGTRIQSMEHRGEKLTVARTIRVDSDKLMSSQFAVLQDGVAYMQWDLSSRKYELVVAGWSGARKTIQTGSVDAGTGDEDVSSWPSVSSFDGGRSLVAVVGRVAYLYTLTSGQMLKKRIETIAPLRTRRSGS